MRKQTTEVNLFMAGKENPRSLNPSEVISLVNVRLCIFKIDG